MPCFVTKPNPPSKEDYEIWKRELGYLGSYEEYLEFKLQTLEENKGQHFVVCGSFEGLEHCGNTGCLDFGDFLCDYPVSPGKSCDYLMCHSHANQVGADLHYCDAHFALWLKQRPIACHVSENPVGVLVGEEFYPINQLWVAKNVSVIKNLPIIKVFPEN